jgi:hypothetical protein
MAEKSDITAVLRVALRQGVDWATEADALDRLGRINRHRLGTAQPPSRPRAQAINPYP